MSLTPPHHLRVFLASPGDVTYERELANDLLKNELPYDPLVVGRATFELVSWDNPTAPKPMLVNLSPQKAVNRFGYKPSECDIVIVILWSRLGTPLDLRAFSKPNGEHYLSGTEFEFENACNAQQQPDIFVYRRDEVPKIELNDPALEEKRRQYQCVGEFCNKITENADGSFKGSITLYKTPTDFKNRLENDLKYVLKERFRGGDLNVGRATVSVWLGSPYPGLRAFTGKESSIFFGREHEVEILVNRLNNQAQRFITVIGGSGTGKSSLINAGLLPKFNAAIIEGSRDWRVITFTPGSTGNNPFLALAEKLNPMLPEAMQKEPTKIAEALEDGPEHLLEYATPILATHLDTGSLVLVVDQLEELFAPSVESYRSAFANLLAYAATGSPYFRVLATLRADYLPHAMAEKDLARHIQNGIVPLGPPGPSALVDMIRKPALRAGLDLETELVDEIIKDAGNNSGALPLVAFCLDEMYKHDTLTLDAYRALGGLRGAIGRRTDTLLKNIKKNETLESLGTLLPLLFDALVRVDATGLVTRKRALKEELKNLPPPIPQLVETLIQEHLFLAEYAGNRATVALAHEALLQEWSALRIWIESNLAEKQRLERLVLSLNAPELEDRIYAAENLASIGRRAIIAMPALIRALGDANEWVRLKAIEALGHIGEEAVPVLCHVLKDADERVRGCIVDALGKIGPSAVPVLTLAFNDTKRRVRIKAAEALSEIGPGAVGAAPALIQGLSDADVRIRFVAAKTLWKIGPDADSAVPALVQAIGDPDKDVRWAATKALGEIGPKAIAAVPALCQAAFVDSDWETRWAVTKSLGKIGPPAVPTLIQFLVHTDEVIRWRAVSTLKEFGGDAVGAIPALIRTLGDSDEQIGRGAAMTLGNIGTAAVPALIQALVNTDERVRSNAADALGEIGPPAVIALESLINALDDSARLVRCNTAKALGKIWPPAAVAVPALIEDLGHPEEQFRKMAVERFAANLLKQIRLNK